VEPLTPGEPSWGDQLSDASNIGPDLVAMLRDTVGDQVHKAIARHIFTKIRDARNDPDTASRRWAFELIQNAHDAGPRQGRNGIILTFSLKDGILRFEHDAAPFNMSEFAALLTGGSSKDFRSTETTGRFGTGFLVTHVLSHRVGVSGILKVNDQHRAFHVDLDRPEDENLILKNIKDSENTLEDTRLIDDLDHEATAAFDYIVDDEKIALAGLDALEEALPHLFATCRRLREINIERGGQQVRWQVVPPNVRSKSDGIHVIEFNVSRSEEDEEKAKWRVIRAATSFIASGRLIVALQEEGDAWAVRKPGNVPSVFRQLPLLGGPTLPGWVIVDGQFDVEQERRIIHVAGEAGRPLREAFAALGGLMQWASRQGWINGFRIAHLSMPAEVTGDTATLVWKEVLSSAAATLSRLPIVRTARGDILPAVQRTEDERWADFISQAETGPTFEELWHLAAASTGSDPPEQHLSKGWSEVAAGWEELGVEISWVGLNLIGERVSGGVDRVAELNVDGPPYEWLARYVDAVGKSWKAGGTVKADVSHLLPDQHGKLRDADKLNRDGGIALRVKEIAADVGLDIKSELLDLELVEALKSLESEPGFYAIQEATEDELTESDAIAKLIKQLSAALPDNQKLNEKNEKAATATISLFAHLWETQGKEAAEVAFGIPVLASDGTAQMPRSRRVMVPPVAAWPQEAQPFASVYPPHRVLSQRYVTTEESILDALTAWGIAHSGLIVTNTREEVHERGLRPIALHPDQVIGATLRDATMTQIALLEPELIMYCKQSRERAQALLGLIVCYVAGADPSWRSTIEMEVRMAEGKKKVILTPSLWISDVRSKPWIPVDEDGDDADHPATPTLVRDLLDPSWLQGNSDGADLLVRHFGIDALDVRLLAAASTEEERQKLRNGLARFVEVVGGDSEAIEEMIFHAQQRQKDVSRMRRLGLAVQECVKAAMEKRGLSVGDIDHGYDYYVTAVEVTEDGLEELTSHFEVAGYKVEVKTTTTGEARLTPLQAATSATEPDVFVLCVVDLRNYDGDVHQVDWTGEDVSPLCKLVWGHDLPVEHTIALVESAEGTDIPIRNSTALRYAVGSELWEAGLDFDEWVESAFKLSEPVGLKA